MHLEDRHLVEERQREKWCMATMVEVWVLKWKKRAHSEAGSSVMGWCLKFPGKGMVKTWHTLVIQDLQSHLKAFRFYFKDDEKTANDFRQRLSKLGVSNSFSPGATSASQLPSKGLM